MYHLDSQGALPTIKVKLYDVENGVIAAEQNFSHPQNLSLPYPRKNSKYNHVIRGNLLIGGEKSSQANLLK